MAYATISTLVTCPHVVKLCTELDIGTWKPYRRSFNLQQTCVWARGFGRMRLNSCVNNSIHCELAQSTYHL